MARSRRAVVFAIRVVLLAVLVTRPPATLFAADAPEPFPSYPGLRDAVDFWTRVFSQWRLGQVIVHDMEHLGVVYEVVPLPGPRTLPYTESQLEFVEGLRESWASRLEALQSELEAGEPLTEAESALAAKITGRAGSEALRRAADRVRTQRGLREHFRRGFEISSRYEELFREILASAGVPEDLFYLAHVESSFQSAARSTAGAAGIWQFTRGTGRRFLVIDSVLDERLDPLAATRAAADYLARAYEALGDWPMAITAYNHGLQGMLRAREAHGNDLPRIVREYRGRVFGFASRNFYAEFLAARRIARDPERFFPEGIRPEPPLELDRIELERREPPGGIALRHGVRLDDLAALNPAWSDRAVRRGLPLPAGTTVWLPAGTLAKLRNEYTVRRGDNLSTIARRFGVSVAGLRRLNDIPPPGNLIHPGQRLRIRPAGSPAVDSVRHVVRRGDTLIEIASAYGVDLVDLLLANGLSRESIIHPGQDILVPGG